MTDVTNAPVQPPDDGGLLAPQSTGTAGFLATTSGKVVAGAVALLILVILAGAIVLMFASGGVTGLLNSGNATITSTTTKSSAGAAAPVDAAPVVNPSEKPLQTTFTFRNVFAPTIKPVIKIVEVIPTAATPEPTTPSTIVTSPTVTPVTTTLTLNSIVLVGDAYKGNFTWNGVTYTAGNGETIGSSPWKVIEVSVPELGTVSMLYGDAQQTIIVGESITK